MRTSPGATGAPTKREQPMDASPCATWWWHCSPLFFEGRFATAPTRRRTRATRRRGSGGKERLPLVAPEEAKTLREFEAAGIAMRRCATKQHALNEQVQGMRALLHFDVLREMSGADLF